MTQRIYRIATRFIPPFRRLLDILNHYNEEIGSLENRLRASENRISALEKYATHLPVFNASNRHLSSEELLEFAKEWLPRLDPTGVYNMKPEGSLKMLGYLAHRICIGEAACIGRIGGNIETVLLRVLVSRSIQCRTLNVLEVGTMFGSGMAVIYESCLGLFDDVHITVIDPLDGFYGEYLEPRTKMPVNREVFEHNMRRMGLPDSSYTLIQRLSYDEEAIKQASKRKYDVLLIDGDHSRFGVKSDFLTYSPFVKPGGYILFDDYDTNYPDIMSFVEQEVTSSDHVELIGTGARTAVFRALGNK